MHDLRQLLNVAPTASPAEVEAAYARERARLIANEEGDQDRLARQLKALDEAFAALNDRGQGGAPEPASGAPPDAGALAVAPLPDALATPPVPSAQQTCPHCGGQNPLQATMCGQCGQQVSRPCPNCGQPVALGQPVCPRCSTFIPEYDQRRLAEGLAVEQRVQQERRTSDVRVQALEEGHRARAWQGLVFWLIVFALCLSLCMAALVLPSFLASVQR